MAGEGDKTDLCFRDPVWLERNPLNEETWIYYFSGSQDFYDPNCIQNQFLKEMKSVSDMATLCSDKVGIQYVLIGHDAERGIFVIEKQQRSSSKSTSPLSHFYILQGTIYQSPTLLALLNSRLVRMCGRV
eukprot:c258_g1_i1.p1 GENE.c258_g1_i1~~c258_g1_i1.p1  ORF type:complete len:130 (-),score=17.96 c258_g1_i1:312-701(-)